MKTLTMTLPDGLSAFVASQTAAGGDSSADDDLLALIADARRRQARRDLEAKLLEGLDGPAEERTRDVWDAIRREALGGLTGEAPKA